jgi:hypothetical protein
MGATGWSSTSHHSSGKARAATVPWLNCEPDIIRVLGHGWGNSPVTWDVLLYHRLTVINR